MATTIGALRVELSANIAKFEAAMGKAAKNMARTQRSFERFGSRASAAGRSLSVGLTAPLVAVGALAAKSFLSFERGMNKVAAVSGATEAEMASLTAIAKDLGATTSFSAAQAAEGLGFLAQAGFDATEAGRALPGVLQLAAAGGIQLAEAADIATNVLAGYGLEVDQLARVNDVLAKASSSANTDVLQLGQAFKFAGPVARSAGISFEQSGAAMALMGNAGIQAEMAGTALRGAITKLVNPSNEAATTMAELGISATDSEGRLRPLDEIIEQLAPHADNTGAIMQIFGQRAGPAMAALVSQGADALREMTTALEQSGGTAQEIADKKLAGLTGAWTKLKSATEGVFIEIGSRLSPVLERLAALLTDRVLPAVRGALEAFDRLSPGMQTAVIAATAVTAALGPLLIVVGGVAATLTPLLPALVALGKTKAVVAGLAAVKTALVAVGLAAPAAAAGVVGVGAAATGTTAAVNTTTLSLARLRVALLTQLPTFTRWGRAITAAAATAGTAMSGLATGAGAKLAGAFGGLKVATSGLGAALVPLAPAAAIVATGFASWKLGRWIGETTGLTDAVERLALRLQGFTDEEIRTVRESRKLLEETEKLRAAFDEFAEPLEALAAKDMAAWTNATKEAKDKARELADALPRTEIQVEHLSRAVHEFAAEGKLTPRVMREIGRQASALGFSLEELPPELKNIVTWLNRTAVAAAEAGPPVDELASGVGGLTDEVQTLVDRLLGTGAIQAAENWAAALDRVGGLTTLTDDETTTLNDTLQAALGAYQRLGDEAPAHLVALAAETGRAVARAREPLQGLVDDVFSIQAIAATSRQALADLITTQGLVGNVQFGRTLPSTPLAIDARVAPQPVTVPLIVNPTVDWSQLTTTMDRISAAFQGFGAEIGPTFARALEGGGNFLGAAQSLGVQGGTKLGEALSGGLATTMTTETSVFSKGIGQFFGKAMGQAIPFLGPLIGLGIGKIFGAFTKPSEAELAARTQVKDYEDTILAGLSASQLDDAADAAQGHWAGNERGAQFLIGVRDAYVAAGRSAREAEQIVGRYWAAIKHGGPDAVASIEAQIDAVVQVGREQQQQLAELATSLFGIVDAGHAAFNPAQLDPYLAQMEELGLVTAAEAASLRQMADDAHVDWRGMEAAAKQYGVGMKTVLDESGREVQVLDESLLGLGHAQAKLTDEGGQLASAWALLTDEGGHMQAAIEGMTDEAQVFVARALEMGIALPAAMKPMLEAMVEQGRLTDQNGEKLEDLSGLTFADPIAAQFDRLADSIQMLIIALGGPSGLSQAVEDMVDSAGLEIEDLAGEWAGMTEDAKAQFGSFAAFVEDQALRQIAAAAGVHYDEIAAKWEAMTDEEKAAFESFAAFLDEQALKKLVDDAGKHYDDLEQKWTDMTEAQRGAIGSFREFVNAELAKINDRTVTVTTQHQTEGFPSGGDEPVFGARHGTPFRDFGRGTPGMLHGLERVMTAMEGRGIKAALGRITGGLAAIADLSGVRSLATGGLVTRPMIAQLHPSEAVVPLDRMAEFGGGRRVEAKLDQLHQDFALLLDEFRHGLDPRRRARALVAAAALSTT